MLRKLAITLTTACVFAPLALGVQVQLGLTEVEPGAWDLFAKVDPTDGDVIGLSGISGDIYGVDPREISFELGSLQTVDPTDYSLRGFGAPLSGPIGVDQFFSFYAGKATSSGNTEVMGIGIEPISIDGPGGTGINLAANAHIGRFTTPHGLTAPDFRNFQVSLFPAGYAGLNSMPTIDAEENGEFTVSILPHSESIPPVDDLPLDPIDPADPLDPIDPVADPLEEDPPVVADPVVIVDDPTDPACDCHIPPDDGPFGSDGFDYYPAGGDGILDGDGFSFDGDGGVDDSNGGGMPDGFDFEDPARDAVPEPSALLLAAGLLAIAVSRVRYNRNLQ